MEKIYLIKTTDAFTPDQKLFMQKCIGLWRLLENQWLKSLIAKIEQWKALDPSAKLYFRPKCDSNVEEEEESYENSDVEDDEEEIQLKGIFLEQRYYKFYL